MNRYRILLFWVLAITIQLSCRVRQTEPPAIALLEPADNMLVPSVVLVQARPAPLDARLEVRLFVDHAQVARQTARGESLVTFAWDASHERPWSRHTLYVTVTDEWERMARSDSARVTIAAASGPTAHSGMVSQDETWYAQGNPHIVRDIMNVEAKLTIEPGCIIEFEQDCGLDIGSGAVVAQGGDTGITFTGSNPTPGWWGAVQIGPQAQAGQTRLENCTVEYGGGPGRGAALVAYSPVSVNACRISHSASYGVITSCDFLSFQGNTVTANIGAPVRVPAASVPTLGGDNRFLGNRLDFISVIGGDVTQDTRWDNLGVPYRVDGNLAVDGRDATARFMPGPGTTLQFVDGDIEIGERGALVADGSNGVITFGWDEPGPGQWGGIVASGNDDPASPSVILKNCRLEAADGEAALVLSETGAEISGTVIANSENSAIVLAGTGNPLGANVVISDCRIDGAEGDALIRVNNARVEVSNTSIVNARRGSGVEVTASGPRAEASAQLNNCTIRNVTLAGIMVARDQDGGSASAFLTDCAIDNVTTGPGVQLSDARAGLLRTRITGARDYGVVCDDEAWFTEFRDNLITGCGQKAVRIGAEYARTIGTGNELTGNDLDEDRFDAVLVTDDEEITTPGTWHSLDVPWLIQGDIYISDEFEQFPTLTIEPGARLEFEDGIMEVEGGLLADGTAGRITFTSGELTPSPGAWDGIYFERSELANRSVLRNCLIEYGGGSDANVFCDGSAPTIENCEISYSDNWGIVLRDSPLHPDTLRKYNRFHDNERGDIDSTGLGRPARRPRVPALPQRRAAAPAPARSPESALYRGGLQASF